MLVGRRSRDTSTEFRIHFFLRRLFPMLAFVVVLFCGLSIIISDIVTTSTREKFQQDSISLLGQTKRSFESAMSEIYALTLILTYDTSTVATIKNCLQDTQIRYSDIHNIRSSIMIPLAATRPYIDSIYIYFKNDNDMFIANTAGVRSLKTYYDTDWFESAESFHNQNKMIWSELRSYNQYGFRSLPTEVVTLYQRSLYRDGIIVLNMNRDYFNKQLNEMVNYKDQVIYVLDEDGQVLFSNIPEMNLSAEDTRQLLSAGPIQEWKKDYYLSSAKADFSPQWTFVSIVPKASLLAPVRQINLLIILVMITTCLLVSVIASLRVWSSYKSIHRIMDFIEQAKKSPDLPAATHREPKEYEFIVESLVEAYTRENLLNQQLLENKYKAVTLELKSLQAQINPHFLLNTLQSIFWASFNLTGGYNHVSKMIEDLNTILGYLLETDQMLVPIEKELRNLESYISIQQARTNHKFEMQWDVPEHLRSYYTGKLLFQPILENSILHGFPGEGHWLLRFKIRQKGEQLHVIITDNGIGITESSLLGLREKLNQTDLVFDKHIGLFNSNRRLQLLFGQAYHICVRSKSGMGTQVTICMPLLTQEDAMKMSYR